MRNRSVAIVVRDGKILMERLCYKDANNGREFFSLPGGGIEEGETPDECVLREVMEETGLRLTEYRLRGKVYFISEAWDDEEMYLYSATGFEGEIIRNCDEGDLCWVEKEKVFDLPMWEGDRYFLKEMLSSDDDIDMTLIYKGQGDDEHLHEVINN